MWLAVVLWAWICNAVHSGPLVVSQSECFVRLRFKITAILMSAHSAVDRESQRAWLTQLLVGYLSFSHVLRWPWTCAVTAFLCVNLCWSFHCVSCEREATVRPRGCMHHGVELQLFALLSLLLWCPFLLIVDLNQCVYDSTRPHWPLEALCSRV